MSVKTKIEKLGELIKTTSPEEELRKQIEAMSPEEVLKRIKQYISILGEKRIREMITELGETSPLGQRLKELSAN